LVQQHVNDLVTVLEQQILDRNDGGAGSPARL
jgi:hypothetical protein